jgi:hypothetical protein
MVMAVGNVGGIGAGDLNLYLKCEHWRELILSNFA